MKKIILFLFAISLLFLSGCNGQDLLNDTKADDNNKVSDQSLYVSNINEEQDGMLWRSREINYPKEVTDIDKDTLCSTIWRFNPVTADNLILVFYLDDEFRMGTYQAGIELGGKYEITEEGSVRLYDFKYSIDRLEEIINFENEELILSFDNNFNSIFYSNVLKGKNPTEFFGAVGGYALEGNIYSVDGYETVKESWTGVTIDRLKFRVEPKLDSDTIGIYYGDYNSNIDKLDYFLRGMSFQVVGRTVDKYKVGEIENYWYYIAYTPFEEPVFGWVYGEYIQEFDESKEDEYRTIFREDLNAFSN